MVRVKRWSKSPPLRARARRHGKPHRVQGQIGDHGAARSSVRKRELGPGYWLQRQMILSTRKSEDKIRLTALPKSLPITAPEEKPLIFANQEMKGMGQLPHQNGGESGCSESIIPALFH